MPAIYLDANATTAILPEVLEYQHEIERRYFANPSSLHRFGREARRVLAEARAIVADCLEAKESEIFFTSGATESINTVLRGVFSSFEKKRAVLVLSPLEHAAVLETSRALALKGAEIRWLDVDRLGRIDLEGFRTAMDEPVAFASVMLAQNEIGNIYPIEKMTDLTSNQRVFFHCDAVQAFGKIPVSVRRLKADALSFSAHKFHGPRGVGGFYLREGLKIPALHAGGLQEGRLRAGTENLSGIAAMAFAIKKACTELEARQKHMQILRDRFERKIFADLEGVSVRGDLESRLPNTSNLGVLGVDGESLLFNLDLEGLALSAGSACESGALDPSHVLVAMGFSNTEAMASVRLSVSCQNTEKEIDQAAAIFIDVVRRLRKKG